MAAILKIARMETAMPIKQKPQGRTFVDHAETSRMEIRNEKALIDFAGQFGPPRGQ
jgi:hypothetical protein